MFYTKYRPQKFSELSKPNDVAESLMTQVKNGKVSHAYLFIGSRGTGKTTTARILAKALNCKKLSSSGDPCDKCENCLAIKAGNFIDLIEIDAASNRGIDDIRELKDRVRLSPSLGKRKVYIIDEVHMLTNEAFNALLKTLEEPPAHVNFILCTTEAHKVPDTIKSRCQVFKFKRASVAQLVEKLGKIAKDEEAKVSKETFKKIAQASLGGFRDAETLLQQVIEGNLSADSLLNMGSKQNYIDFVDFLNNKDAASAIKVVNKIYEEGIDLYVWAGELIKYLRDLLFVAVSADEGMVDTTDELYDLMKKQALDMNSAVLIKILDFIMKAQNEIKSSFITQLPLELCIVEICSLGEDSKEVSKKETPKMPQPSIPLTHIASMKKDDKKVYEDEDTDDTEDLKKDEPSNDLSSVELSVVEENWLKVLHEVKNTNSSVCALLKSSKPLSIESDYVVVEVFYAFHKERLESTKARKIVEQALKDVLGIDLRIKCKVSGNRPKKIGEKETGELTDLNVIVPSAKSDNALDLFDGGLSLG